MPKARRDASTLPERTASSGRTRHCGHQSVVGRASQTLLQRKAVHAAIRCRKVVAIRHSFKLPIYDSALPFPNVFNRVGSEAFATFRRFGQRFHYKWCWLRDEKF